MLPIFQYFNNFPIYECCMYGQLFYSIIKVNTIYYKECQYFSSGREIGNTCIVVIGATQSIGLDGRGQLLTTNNRKGKKERKHSFKINYPNQ